MRERLSSRSSSEGIGIPADDVAHIFERFFQVDDAATRRFGGTGMGLALVDQVGGRRARRHRRGGERRRIRNTGGRCAGRRQGRSLQAGAGKRTGGVAPCRYDVAVVALGGAVAVPCTRNPL